MSEPRPIRDQYSLSESREVEYDDTFTKEAIKVMTAIIEQEIYDNLEAILWPIITDGRPWYVQRYPPIYDENICVLVITCRFRYALLHAADVQVGEWLHPSALPDTRPLGYVPARPQHIVGPYGHRLICVWHPEADLWQRTA